MAKKTVAATTGAAAATKLAAAAAAAGTAAAAAGTQARSQASDLGERLAPVVGDARERLAPVVVDARERLAPVVVDARERLAPVVDDVRERLVDLTADVATRVDDLSSTVATRLDDLTGTVATRLDEALPDKYTPAAVTARVPAKNHPNRFLQALLVLGLGAVAAIIARRLTGGRPEPVWRSAGDQPTSAGAPATTATGSTPGSAAGLAAATTAGESAGGLLAGNDHAAGTTSATDTTVSGPVETSVDVAGGTPEEVAADATDTPHDVTTPDDPAHKVVLD
jgi:hypothetical protein